MGDQKTGTTINAHQLNPFAASNDAGSIPCSWLSLEDHELHAVNNAATETNPVHSKHEHIGLTLNPNCVLPIMEVVDKSHLHHNQPSADTMSSVSDVSAKLYSESSVTYTDPLLEKKQQARVDVNRFMAAPLLSDDNRMMMLDECAMVTNQYKVLENILTRSKKLANHQYLDQGVPVAVAATKILHNPATDIHIPSAQARPAPLAQQPQTQSQPQPQGQVDPFPFPQGMSDPKFIREQQEAYARFQGQDQVQQEPAPSTTLPFLKDINDAQFIREQQEALARFQQSQSQPNRNDIDMEAVANTCNTNAASMEVMYRGSGCDAKMEFSDPQGFSYQNNNNYSSSSVGLSTVPVVEVPHDICDPVVEENFFPQNMKDANFIRQQEEAFARFQSQGNDKAVKTEKRSGVYRNNTEQPARNNNNALNQYGNYAESSSDEIFNMEKPAQAQPFSAPVVDEVDRFMPLQIEDKLVTWKAIEQGNTCVVECPYCVNRMFVVLSSQFVLCDNCNGVFQLASSMIVQLDDAK